MAHGKGIRVVPLVGPSSILLALMASGMNGQRFTFLGYLPIDKSERIQKLREIEKRSQQLQETQVFIEAPYRNQHMLQDIVDTCQADTRLCIASNISLDNELIVSKSIADWKKSPLPDLNRQPTVFLLLG
jgi:16S rRNA (cytidine1402-2'-O)-methyltransferase